MLSWGTGEVGGFVFTGLSRKDDISYTAIKLELHDKINNIFLTSDLIRTSDLIFFNFGALPNFFYITLQIWHHKTDQMSFVSYGSSRRDTRRQSTQFVLDNTAVFWLW